MLKLRLTGVPMDEEGMLPDAFESLCKIRKVKALYCIPTMQNPTTATLPEARRKKIAALAEKYDVIVVEDDIHRRLVPDAPPLITSLIPHRSVLVASSSKTVAGGLRTGFLLPPAKLKHHILQTLQATLWTPSPLPFEVFANWMENGTIERVLEDRRNESAERLKIAVKMLGSYDIRFQQESFFLWLTLPEGWNQSQFMMEAHRQGVSVAAAQTFAIDEKEAPDAVRIALGTPDNREILTLGLQKLAGILERGPQAITATF
jgi:DNA-binding transcriptional MocR family regulator